MYFNVELGFWRRRTGERPPGLSGLRKSISIPKDCVTSLKSVALKTVARFFRRRDRGGRNESFRLGFRFVLFEFSEWC